MDFHTDFITGMPKVKMVKLGRSLVHKILSMKSVKRTNLCPSNRYHFYMGKLIFSCFFFMTLQSCEHYQP